MRTDSSSGTFPPSSRVTMVSSSSIARSKLSFLTSTWVFSAISLSQDAPAGADSETILRRYCGGRSPPPPCPDCCRNPPPLALPGIAPPHHPTNSPPPPPTPPPPHHPRSPP